MKANEDHFKFFIEDDQTFEDYLEEMLKDSTWGGNLEIYVNPRLIKALSMRFNINFFIHIYDHPMYIVKNHESPLKDIHLSYHDGVIIECVNLF